MILSQIIKFEYSLASGSTTAEFTVNDSNIFNEEWQEETIEKEIIW